MLKLAKLQVVIYVLFQNVMSDSLERSHFESGFVTNHNDFSGMTLKCADYTDCLVNCLQTSACSNTNIIGPKHATLTLNCDIDSGSPGDMNGGCSVGVTINATQSNKLVINAYNDKHSLAHSRIYTPNTEYLNTFITCGVIGTYGEDSRPSLSVCGYDNRIYSAHGWSTVHWKYDTVSPWSLDYDTSVIADQVTMFCGDNLNSFMCTAVRRNDHYNCVNSTCAFTGSYATAQPSIAPLSPTKQSGWTYQSESLSAGLWVIIGILCASGFVVGIIYYFHIKQQNKERNANDREEAMIDNKDEDEEVMVETVATIMMDTAADEEDDNGSQMIGFGKEGEMSENEETVKQWFEEDVELNEADKMRYYRVFIENGFENFAAIKTMNKQSLMEMGITKMGHINMILVAIDNL